MTSNIDSHAIPSLIPNTTTTNSHITSSNMTTSNMTTTSTPKDVSSPSHWIQSAKEIMHPVAAGYIAGSCGIIVGHPLDSLKVLLQTGQRPSSSTSSSSTSATSIITKRSIRSLYAGVGVPLVTVGLMQSINFGIYDTIRRCQSLQQYHYYDPNTNKKEEPLWNTTISASVAGGILSFLTSPFVVIKTKQQIMVWSMKKAAYKTWYQQSKGGRIRNFYIGFGPHFACESFGRGVYMTTYEYLKRQRILSKHKHNPDLDDDPTMINRTNMTNNYLNIPERMICAGIAGMTCWTVIFPLDVLRNKQYAHAAISSKTSVNTQSSYTVMMELWKNGGMRSFFRGFEITVIRAGPVAAAVLPVYDLVLEWLRDSK